jgi:hypothetical protein
MAEKKKPKKPKPEGGEEKRGSGKGRSWLFWALLLVAIVLIYAISAVPAAVLGRHLPAGRGRDAYRSACAVVYGPVERLAAHYRVVGDAYAWAFRRCGIP